MNRTRTRKSRNETCRIGVDVGGTFTDAALEIGSRRYTTKVLTTPRAPEQGVLEAISVVIADAGIAPGDMGLIIHGTTLATNALIERKGARTALVTTDGFRDVLEIRSEDRYEQYDPFINPPAVLVPRHLRFVVAERMDARGKTLLKLDEAGLRKVAQELRAAKVEAVAVGFLHSYVNPAHEIRAGKILRSILGSVPISLSHQVSGEMREYERFSTTCANAYVQPKMAGYLERLSRELKARGFNCPLLLMQSGGGLTTVQTSMDFPIRLVESGPAGGAIFSAHVAAQCGLDNVLSFDMGGTTAKVCLIDHAKPQTSRTFEVAREYRFKKGSGLPLRIPVIEMVEIGAGGGSIARLDKLGRITVGPDSAGSEPGPACYGRGGKDVAVTDADVLLGRIDADNFAGGRIKLDRKASADAAANSVGNALKIGPEIAAYGIAEIVDENMASAARVHAIESGKDVTDYTMIAFGGAAPLHVGRIAEKLNVARFIVPSGAGVGSTLGFLRAPVAYEIVRSFPAMLDSFDLAAVNRTLDEMRDEARDVVAKAALGGKLVEQRLAFMRYVGQGHEIPVPLPARTLRAGDVAELRKAFDKLYGQIYSRAIPDRAVEILTWALTVGTETKKVSAVRDPRGGRTAKPDSMRQIFDPAKEDWIKVPVYERDNLSKGDKVKGPAVIVERETSTFLPKGYDAVINGLGYIDCRRVASPARIGGRA